MWEEKGRVLQNGRAVLVGRAAMVVAGMRRVIMVRIRRGVGMLLMSDAFFHNGGFPMFEHVGEGGEGEKHDAKSNEQHGVSGAWHRECWYSQGSLLSSAWPAAIHALKALSQ
jgi:hypothetical protein